MIEITADIQGDRQMSVALGVVAESLKDFSAPLGQVGHDLLKSFDQNFESRGALFESGGWAPRKDNNPWPLLERRGDMRSEFRSDVESDSVTLTNDAPYFKYHQSNAPRTRLPRRVMMALTDDSRTQIVKTFQVFLVGVIRGKH